MDNPNAARSVHLWYKLPDGVASVTNEVCVKETTPGTYFCILGFSTGYSGIQELYDGQHKLIFSVWDNKRNEDPSLDKQVKVLYSGDKVEVSRFGGEGTGAKTMMPYDWKVGVPVRFKLEAEVDESGLWTKYSCYVYNFDEKSWFHIATLQTITHGQLIKGVYSFIEDFRRDKKSFHERRCADFGDCCSTSNKGEVKCCQATFTADSTPVCNINAGCCDGKFFLQTGANTKNTDTKLNDTIAVGK